MSILSVRNFQKRYGDKIAVRDLSLTVEAGDIYGFIGHNGAGKTTLIRSIVGAQSFEGGAIEVCGHDVMRDAIAAKRARRIEELSHRLDLADALADPIASYSHGMRQKLVIIGALVHSPRLLVLDEPFVGLDPVASHELKLILHEHARAGAAVFFSSHVLEVVEKLCNKLTIIRAGEVLAQGTTEQVRGDNALEDVFLELVEQEA